MPRKKKRNAKEPTSKDLNLKIDTPRSAPAKSVNSDLFTLITKPIRENLRKRAECIERVKSNCTNRHLFSAIKLDAADTEDLAGEYQLGTPSHKVVFAIDELFHNQKLRAGDWLENEAGCPQYTDSSGKIKLHIKEANDLSSLGVCCSEWRWLSEWTPMREEANSEWMYSAEFKAENFKNTKSAKDVYRRQKLFRARFLQTPGHFEEIEVVYLVLRELITEVLIKMGHSLSIESEKEFIKKFKSLYQTISITNFNKDVYALFSSSQVSDNKEEDAEKIMAELKGIFDIFLCEESNLKQKIKNLDELENLIDKLSNYRAAFKNDTYLDGLMVGFLLQLVADVAKRENEEFLVALHANFSQKHSRGKIAVCPLKLILDILSVHGAKAVGNAADVRNKLQSAVRDFYVFENERFAELVGDSFRIIAIVSESSQLSLFFQNTTRRSFRNMLDRKRGQFPLDIGDFIQEDWEDFRAILDKIVEEEIEEYLPNLLLPGANPHPGDSTVAQLVRNLVTEMNEFYATENPSNTNDENVRFSLKTYSFLQNVLLRPNCKRFLRENTAQSLSLLFIDVDNICRDQIADILERGFSEIDAKIGTLKEKKKRLHYDKDSSENLFYTKEALASIKSMKADLLRVFENSVLSPDEKRQFIEKYVADTKSRFERIFDILFRIEKLKKTVVEAFLVTDRQNLGVEKSQSIARQSDIFTSLGLSESVRSLECGETEKIKRLKALSAITTKLCVYFNNVFLALEGMAEFGEDVEAFCAQLRRNGALGDFDLRWDVERLYERCDVLVEILALRLAVYDSEDFLQLFLTSESDRSEEVDDRICNYISKLGHISNYVRRDYCVTVFEATKNFIFKTIDWMLLGSDRSFKQKHCAALRSGIEHINQIFNFFLPEKRQRPLADSTRKVLNLMALDDSELLSAFREVRDKGLSRPEFTPDKAKTSSSSSAKVLEKKELSLTSFFENYAEDPSSPVTPDKKAEDDLIKLSKSERNDMKERIMAVISRRRTDLCRKFAKDSRCKVPFLAAESDNTSSENSQTEEERGTEEESAEDS